MKKILIASSLLYDYIMDFQEKFEDHIIPEKIKSLSITFQVDNLSKNFGGNGGNIAYTLSLLSNRSTLMTSIGGNDGKQFLDHLEKSDIDISHVNVVADEFTGVCFIMTDATNSQITAYYPGAMKHDATLNMQDIPDLNDHELVVITTSTPEAQVRFVSQAIALGKPYVFIPGQEIARLKKEELVWGISHAKVLIVNDYELAFILKITNRTKSELIKNGTILITTLGVEGSTIENDNIQEKIKAVHSDTIVDPTGAGDAYIAGFVAGYVRKLPLRTCGQMGSLCATYAMEHYGTQKHVFTTDEFASRYKEAFDQNLLL